MDPLVVKRPFLPSLRSKREQSVGGSQEGPKDERTDHETATDEQGRVFREAWIAGENKHYPGEPKPSYVTPSKR